MSPDTSPDTSPDPTPDTSPDTSPDALNRSRRRPSPGVQFVDLLLIQLSNFRWSWRGMVVTGMAVPVMSIIALGVLSSPYGESYLTHVLAGSVVLSLMFQTLNNVAGNFAFMKAMGTLDFFATLPVHRHMLILATVIAFFLLSIPSIVATVVFGALFLGVPLDLSPLALVVFPLCATPLAAIGALIGAAARNPEEAGSLSLLLTITLLFLGPVMLPSSTMPDWLLRTSHISPASHAASALRQVMFGPVTGRLWLDIGALVAFSCATLWLVGRRVQWRVR